MTTSPIKVLVVDGSADDAELMLLELRRAGYTPSAERVQTAVGFRAALAGRAWDVILCEDSVPEFDASRALGLLREAGRDVPLVVVSGAAGEERAVELMRAGAADCLTKGRLTRLAPAVEREVRQAADRMALRQARDLVASSDDAIVGQALDGTVTSWNAGAERLYGYAADEIVGHGISRITSPDRPDEEPQLLGRVARGERVEHFETERVRKGGTPVHVTVTLSPVRDDAGRVVGASAVARDITERKRAEQSHRRTSDLLRAVADGSPDAIFVKDRAGRYLLFNEAACRFVGRPVGGVLGRDDTALFGPADARRMINRDRRVMESGRAETEEAVLTAVGATRTYLTTKAPYRDGDGNVVGLVGISRDVTDRTRAEAALRGREALLQTIIAHIPCGVFWKDRDSVLLGCNLQFARDLGAASPDDLIGKTDDQLAPPPEAGAFVARDRRVIETGEPLLNVEEPRSRPGGGATTLLTSKVPLRGPGGAVVGVLGVYQDITERKVAEAALRESKERLQVALAAAGAIAFVWDAVADRVTRYYSVEPALPANEGAPETVAAVLARVHPADRGRFDAGVRACLAAGNEYRNLYRVVRPDGSIRWLEEWGTLSRDAAGGPVRLVGFSMDVTDRKQAEAELRASEDRYRTLLERIPEPLVVYDVETLGYLAVNDAAVACYGYSRDEFLGMTIRDIRPPGDVAAFLDGLARSPRGGFGNYGRWRHRKKDGTVFDVEIAAHDLSLDGRRARIVLSHDVTERKRAEEALQFQHALLRCQTEASPDGMLVVGPDSRILSYNRRFLAVWGIPDEFTATGDDTILLAEARRRTADPDGFFARVAAIYADPDVQSQDEVALADGRTLERYSGPIRGSGGELLGRVWYFRDITTRKRGEAERAELLARLTLQVERMPLAYLLHGPDFRYTGWNPAAERTFGFTEAEVLGRHPFEVVVPRQARPLVADIFARLAAGDMDAHGTNENVTKDGRAIFCEWYNTPLYGPDGTFEGVLSLAQDVTARRQAENELHLRDRAIRAVVGGVVITDATAPDNPITYASPGFEHLTGYAWGEAVGRNCRFLQGEGTDPAAVAEVREAVRRGVACDVELLNYRKDGTPFWNALSVSPVRDDAGRLTHFVGVQTDVTARRRLEEQFRQAQKMEAVGQLAGGVAHDFNNLLTIINGYGEIVHDALPPGDPSRGMVAEITKAGERAAGLTRQLLAFSRRSVLEPRVLDPNALVRDVETMLRRLIGEDIDVAVKLAPDLGRVKADPGQLEQAVVNLCVNARDAMPTGGRLTVETRDVELDAAYAAARPDVRPGRYVVLSVTDTGTGMTPEVQARVFEPFFTTKGVGKGTGLGLAMVFGFVKQSGGHVGVHSEVGRGTAFQLFLPRVGDAPPARESGTIRTPLPRGTETLLLVEDEAAVRALARHVLSTCGYAVLEAGDGREAVTAADRLAGPLHLLVTDVVMPGGMGGRQVAEAVVARHPAARVLFTSGYTDDAVVRHGVLDEGTHFLQKPFTPAALARKVRDVLDGKG